MTERRRAGRTGHNPRKLTPERRQVLLEAVRQGHSQSAAAAIAGISRRTLHRELNRSAVLGRQVDQAKDEAEGHLLNIIIDAAATHWIPAAWILERRFGYTRNLKADVSVMTPEQRVALGAAERFGSMEPAEVAKELAELTQYIRLDEEDRANPLLLEVDPAP